MQDDGQVGDVVETKKFAKIKSPSSLFDLAYVSKSKEAKTITMPYDCVLIVKPN